MRYTWLTAALVLACAGSVPQAPSPGTSQAWGHVRLVPHEGVTPGGHGSHSYGDRRLRGVEFVDYSTPGFAVIYTDAPSAPGGELELEIRDGRVGTHIAPEHGAVGAAGRVVVRNDSAEAHVLSYPAAGLVRTLAPGQRLEVGVPRPGEQGLFLIDRGAEVVIFAAPGPFTVVSSSGDFTLTDLPPGPRRLRAWHPRFPAASADVDLVADASVRVDFDLGVGLDGPPASQ